jgi:RNA polymerase sigma-70 factor (ECF subfamily)
MTSDEQLMLEVKGGSASAFTELFQRYRQPIYGFFRRRLEDPGRAEELAQDTFVAVLRGAGRYEPLALFRTYLYGIALKLFMAERRRKVGATGRPAASAEQDAAAHAEKPDITLWIRNAVDQLRPDEREILLLREFEGLAYEEIASVLRMPVNTVRSRLFRARLALKDRLVPQRHADGREG